MPLGGVFLMYFTHTPKHPLPAASFNYHEALSPAVLVARAGCGRAQPAMCRRERAHTGVGLQDHSSEAERRRSSILFPAVLPHRMRARMTSYYYSCDSCWRVR